MIGRVRFQLRLPDVVSFAFVPPLSSSGRMNVASMSYAREQFVWFHV